MEKYICRKDLIIEDVKFASAGDCVILLPDTRTLVNIKEGQKVTQLNNINNFNEYFIAVSSMKSESNVARVNHPEHYTWLKDKCGIEVIDIIRWLDFDTGNAIKYLLRAGHKAEEGFSTKEKTIEDLNKAIWYIKDKIEYLENEV